MRPTAKTGAAAPESYRKFSNNHVFHLYLIFSLLFALVRKKKERNAGRFAVVFDGVFSALVSHSRTLLFLQLLHITRYLRRHIHNTLVFYFLIHILCPSCDALTQFLHVLIEVLGLVQFVLLANKRCHFYI